MNYNTFKQHMKRLAGEYKDKSFPTNYSFPDFVQWLTLIPEPEKKQEEKWKPTYGGAYFIPSFITEDMYACFYWSSDIDDLRYYALGLVCKTPEEATALAERMLEAVKN